MKTKKKIWTLHDANDLYMQSSRLLTVMERNGMKIDVKRMKKTKDRLNRKILRLEEKLRNTKVYKLWRNRYGAQSNLNSTAQLAEVFFKVLKFKSKFLTATGEFKTDEESMMKLDHPFLEKYFKIKKYKKILGTYIAGIEREVTHKGYVHTNFNQHIAISQRTTSDNPNLQNVPIRNRETGKIIRDLYVSRFKNGHIVERDYSGLEVATYCEYHKDPTMIKYLEEDYDFHKEITAQVLMCDVEDVSKKLRFEGKNKFAFAEFYGDYYKQIAPKLWDSIQAKDLTIKGMPVLKWLKKKGINGLGSCKHNQDPVKGTFEYQVKLIEDDLWKRRFKVLAEWRKKVWNDYLKTGVLKYLHGFEARANLRRNQVINIGNQGFASHCLIWSFAEIQRQIEKMKMRTKLICQIHDSGISDCPPDELQDFLDMSDEVVVSGLKKHFTFLTIKLATEVEVTPKGGSWHDKEAWHRTDRKWEKVPAA